MENYVKFLLERNQISFSRLTDKVISRLIQSAKVGEIYKNISLSNQQIMDVFNRYKETEEFKEYHLVIPNANAKVEYSFQFDISSFPNIKIKEIRNIGDLGLSFDKESFILSGKPILATQIDLEVVFYNEKDDTRGDLFI